MAQVFNRIEMDIRTKIPDIITAVQNDSNSRFLDVFLFDGSTPINLTGHEVRIYCRKPENGGEVFNNGEITEPTNGRCQFPLTDQTLAKVGYVEAQIVIYYQNVQVLQSHPFNISVVESLISSGSVESSNEYGALVVLYQNLYEAYDLMTTMVQTFGLKGQISADRNINTFWQSLEYVAKYLDTDIKNLLDTVLAEANVHGVIDRLGNAADTGATATTGTVMGKSNAILELTNKIEQRYCKIPVSEVKSITCPAKATSGMQNYGEIAFEYVKPISLKAIQIASGYSSCKYYVTIYNGEESYTVATDTGNSNIFLYPGVSGLSQASSLPQYIVYGSIVATKIVIKGYNDVTNTGTTSNITLHS